MVFNCCMLSHRQLELEDPLNARILSANALPAQ